MRLNALSGFVVIALFAALFSGCAENRLSPTSPSMTAPLAAENAPRSGTSLAPRRVDADGDGYEDPEPGPTAPGTPGPIPGDVPPPAGPPPTEGIPTPVQLTVSIVGSFGPTAFAPNPQQAAIGNTVVWMNNDLAPHNIVLSDGTPVGNLAPGQASAPFTLVTDTVSYHCTFHPSMTGQIMPVAPLPTDPSQIPVPTDPSAPPMTPDPYGDGDDGYGDGYDYDYY